MNVALVSLVLFLSAEPQPKQWTIDGTQREALVAVPEQKPDDGSPLVFVFHGHGGNMRGAARRFRLHELWPEAVVVYPQGLPTPTRIDPEGKRPGWQNNTDKDDRDLKWFDAMLADLAKKHPIDRARVYVTGHSNGGGFTYLLWATHAKDLAAVAPISAIARDPEKLAPLPAMHVAGRNDRIAPFAMQEKTIEAIRGVDGCTDESHTWSQVCKEYPSKTGTPVIAFIHDGGHEIPEKAPALVVRFFKEHARAETEGK
jgi:polyhydroxybutyrate depolymerase